MKIALLLALFFGSAANAQTILLQIRPRMGDTLKMRMDQKIDRVGTVNGDTALATSTTTQLFTRAVPISFSNNGTVILTIADSVSVSPRSGSQSEKTQGMQGQSIQLLISTDGAVRLPENKGGKKASSFFANMPATLPTKPVSVGETWVRDMTFPSPKYPSETRTIQATFRLDSLTDNGDIAYISMRGNIAPAGNGAKRDMSGTITGSMQVDRRMAWMTDSRATIKINTVVDSMQVKTKITQWLRAQ